MQVARLINNRGMKGIVKKGKEKAKPRKFGKKAIIGVLLLMCSFFMGALLRNSAEITSTQNSRAFSNVCDTRISWLCIPTFYISIPIEASLWLVLNATSLLSSIILFVSGVILLRE